jgi:hypothetical protein
MYHNFNIDESNRPNFKVLTTYIYPIIVRRLKDDIPKEVDRVIKKIMIPQPSRYVLMPIHRDGDHWALAIFVNEQIPLTTKEGNDNPPPINLLSTLLAATSTSND